MMLVGGVSVVGRRGVPGTEESGGTEWVSVGVAFFMDEYVGAGLVDEEEGFWRGEAAGMGGIWGGVV